MDSESENEVELKPLNIVEATRLTNLNLLPEISKKKYECTYKAFIEWQKRQEKSSFSENVLLEYFAELSKKFKSSTLWTHYSMLRATLNINNHVDISKYARLRGFLKRQSKSYRPKKSKIFTPHEIGKFIKEAPDREYLVTKVALIMGIMGACRRHELYKIKTTNLTDLGSGVLVTIPDTKTKVVRNFTITGQFYKIFKKYADLRPPHPNGPWFFLNYLKGRCSVQRIGINKLGAMGKEIARYLELPNPELYTGHCFRRSSGTVFVDASGDIISLKKSGGWKSSAVVQEYNTNTVNVDSEIIDSIENIRNLATTIKTEIAEESIEESAEYKLDLEKIVDSIENTINRSSTSTTENWHRQESLAHQQDSTSLPNLIFIKFSRQFCNDIIEQLSKATQKAVELYNRLNDTHMDNHECSVAKINMVKTLEISILHTHKVLHDCIIKKLMQSNGNPDVDQMDEIKKLKDLILKEQSGSNSVIGMMKQYSDIFFKIVQQKMHS